MINQYSVDFKLKIVKMILNKDISKKEILKTYNVATKTGKTVYAKYQTEGISGLLSKRKIRDKTPTNTVTKSVESLKYEILHSDQGIVYGSKRFEKAHKAYLITRSMSRAATPTDNPVIDSLNG